MSTPRELSLIERLARAPFLPALAHADERFAAIGETLGRIEKALAAVADSQGRTETALSRTRLSELDSMLLAYTQAIDESAAFVERAAEEIGGGSGSTALPRRRIVTESERGALMQQLLSNEGPVGKAGLWFNPPVVLRLNGGTVELDQIHERIIEIPFVFRALSSVPAGGSVLDVGSSESTVAFSLASMGYRAIAMDQRKYPLQHSRLKVVVANIVDWAGPGEGALDAVVCLSTLEHLGLRAYGAVYEDAELDIKTMKRFREWLKPGGMLVLTMPYGRADVNDFERTYDREGVDRLLEGWDVKERLVFAREGSTEWVPREEGPGSWPENLRGVALVSAVRA